MSKLFCGTSTLMLVRGQFATCVFALHAPMRSSDSSGAVPLGAAFLPPLPSPGFVFFLTKILLDSNN